MKTKTKITSISETPVGGALVVLETPLGERYQIGYSSCMPLRLPEYYLPAIAKITDDYFASDFEGYFNYLMLMSVKNNLEMPLFASDDRASERVRLGIRIREIRKEIGMDAKALAEKANITPANLSRIEQGKYSPGIDIMCRIANALGTRLDFVYKNAEVSNGESNK